MLTLSLIVSVAVAQAPGPTVGLQTRAAPGAVEPRHLDEVAEVLRNELKAAGIADPLMPAAVAERLRGTEAQGCIKGLECLFAAANAAKLDVLVAMDLTELEDDVAIAFEAVAPRQQRRIARASVVIRDREIATALAEQVRPFAQEVAAGLRTLDAPLAASGPRLEPSAPATGASLFDLTTASGKSRVPAYTVGATAVVAAGVATAFAISGSRLRSEFNAAQSQQVSTLTYPETRRLEGQVNTQLNVALAAGITSVALGGLAAWMWPTE